MLGQQAYHDYDKDSPEQRKLSRKISEQIDEQLRKEKQQKQCQRGPKLLLLGSGDSGKTTVLKQMKILHGKGFSEKERALFKERIMDNIVDSIRALLYAMEALDIPFGEPGNEFYARQVKENFPRGQGGSIPLHIHTAIKALWNDVGVRSCLKRSNEFYIQDTADYFLNQLDRFFDMSFLPTDQDILRTRYRTTQITETRFYIDNLIYRIFDVGGQRSDRLFWAPYFEGDMHAILFVISLAAYDQILVEDKTVNRMEDAIQLFGSICSHRLLRECSIILFLNKTDLFEKKLQYSPVSKYFSDYVSSENESELKSAGRYFKRLFLSQNRNGERKIYTHFTTGTDTAHMKVIISAVRDIVTRVALQSSGIY